MTRSQRDWPAVAERMANEPGTIRRDETGNWLVRTTQRTLVVTQEADRFACSCARGRMAKPCAHVLAVQRWEELGAEYATLPTPPGFDKAAARLARQSEFDMGLHFARDLSALLPDPEPRPGNPRLPDRELAYMCLVKLLGNVSQDRLQGLLHEGVRIGALRHVPHAHAPFRWLRDPDTTAKLEFLLAQSALPLAAIETEWAIDSTGFRTTMHGGLWHRWRLRKHAKPGEKGAYVRVEVQGHDWRKAHLLYGLTTQAVCAVIITDPNRNDSPQWGLLLRKAHRQGIRFDGHYVRGDKAYLSRANLLYATELGATPLVPPKKGSNLLANGRGTRASDRAVRLEANLWRRAVNFMGLHQGAFERLYHQRSRAETVNRNIKLVLGETLRGRRTVSQDNELLCKLIAHNLRCLLVALHAHGTRPEWLHELPSQRESKATTPSTAPEPSSHAHGP